MFGNISVLDGNFIVGLVDRRPINGNGSECSSAENSGNRTGQVSLRLDF
jgi:hypothetical protein